jgi:hypothetical protein
MPMVKVVAPDGSRELWAAATGHEDAVAAVKKVIPPDWVATLSKRRLPIGPATERFRFGEVRRVEP